MVVDLVFWGFFGLGFLIMILMVLNVFRTILQGRKDQDVWRSAFGSKFSLFRK